MPAGLLVLQNYAPQHSACRWQHAVAHALPRGTTPTLLCSNLRRRRCVAMLARLWHAPSMDGASSDAVGTACIGSSEAIMLGGELQARNRSHTWLAAEYAKCCMGRLHWQLGTSMLSRTGAGAVL